MSDKRTVDSGVATAPAAARPGLRWVLRMAWRDSRGNRGLLALFMLSVVFGIGAIVAILSLRTNLLEIVEGQAKTLLGADLVLESLQAPQRGLIRFMDRLGGQRSTEIRLRTMAAFDGDGSAQFVQLRALAGTYPFYGSAELEPRQAADLGSLGHWNPATDEFAPAIVEESLLRQRGLSVGDSFTLGNAKFRVSAAMLRISGESEVTGFFAPRIYIPMQALAATGLVQPGSVLRYRHYFAFEDGLSAEIRVQLAEARGGLFVDERVRVETVAQRRQSLERVLGNLFDFLNLIGFTALLLGGVGIGGAVQVYLKSKLNTIAVLRCIGAPVRAAFFIYLLQISLFGFVGALVGTLLGVATQYLLPLLLQSFLPFAIIVFPAWTAIAIGLLVGWVVATLFGLFPLLGIRRISPLSALRLAVDLPRGEWRDPLRWATGGALLALLVGLVFAASRKPVFALAFLATVATAWLLLVLIAAGLRAGLRRFTPLSSPYALRIAMGNLYRPNNRTLLLLVTIGMGVMLLNALFLARSALLQQLRVDGPGDAPNVIFLDVQVDQLAQLRQTLQAMDVDYGDELPVITMRVEAVKGRPLREWRNDPDSPLSEWIYTWEFRNTYRDHVLDNAEIIAGEFIADYSGTEPFPISLSENVLDDLGVGLGDSITWNVQGIPLETVVASVRRIRWQAGRQNFNVVFPHGTIEDAPTVYAVSARSASRQQTTTIQAALSSRFANVSLIDLSLVFDTVNDLLRRAAFVVQFMAAFTVSTGLIVLAGTALSTRYQRINESVLFRTIGASRRFLRGVLTLEFLALGSLAVASGLLLSFVCAWALLRFAFQLPFVMDLAGTLLTGSVVIALTLLTGLLTSRGISRTPPLAILRREG